jgi:hypothetical protein
MTLSRNVSIVLVVERKSVTVVDLAGLALMDLETLKDSFKEFIWFTISWVWV